jgi:hypothetical protein
MILPSLKKQWAWAKKFSNGLKYGFGLTLNNVLFQTLLSTKSQTTLKRFGKNGQKYPFLFFVRCQISASYAVVSNCINPKTTISMHKHNNIV